MTRAHHGPPRNGIRRRGRKDGFTLIEALVAFAVLALFMVTVQRGAIGSLGGLSRAQSAIEAEIAVRTLMTGPLGADPLSSPKTSGTIGRFIWTISLEPLPSAVADRTAGDVDGVATWTPARMRIVVSLPGERRSLASVETVRLVRSGAP